MADLADTLLPADDDERLDQAEATVRSYCGWHIAPSRTDTVTIYPGNGAAVLFLPSLYVTAVVSVTSGATLLDPTSYRWTPNGVLTRTDSQWWDRSIEGAYFDSVTVVFTHGYATVPADVTAAVQSVAGLTSGGSLRSRTAGPFSETYGTDLTTLDQSRLGAYRLTRV